jgi:hypothetical protein
MTERGRIATQENGTPLYVDDARLHNEVAPHLGADTFRALVRDWETRGFPKKKTAVRGRYWSKCKAWLDKQEHVGVDFDVIEDGPETFGNAQVQRTTRVQAKA